MSTSSLSLLLAIVSLFFTIFGAGIYNFYNRKRPAYYYSTIDIKSTLTKNILDLGLLKISMLYNNTEVDNLSITRIGFINLGFKAISKKDDVPITNPFYVETDKEIVIYDIKVLNSAENTNFSAFQVIDIDNKDIDDDYKFKLLENHRNRVYFDFDSLSRNERGIVQICYSKKNNDSKIHLKGDIKRNFVEKTLGIKTLYSNQDKSDSGFFMLILITTYIMCFFCFLITYFVANIPEFRTFKILGASLYAVLYLLILYMPVIVSIYYITGLKFTGYIFEFARKWNFSDDEPNKIIETSKHNIDKDDDSIRFKIRKYCYQKIQ